MKGVETVFICKFYQLQRIYRGSQSLQRLFGRLQVLRNRVIDFGECAVQVDMYVVSGSRWRSPSSTGLADHFSIWA